MLLTIHNLPASTRYADIKTLLQSKCGLQHVILDNLVVEGSGKKVTVGVAEDADAAILVRKVNGLYWNGSQLYVEDVRRQKTSSDQPFRSNPELQERESTESFRPLNLQQHSSYKAAGLPSLMTRAVQPVTSMYCVPDHNSEYNQTFSSMKTGSFMQTQGFEAGTQKVQGALMGISGFSQMPAQMSQVAQFNKNQDISSEPQNRVSVWTDSYNEMQDFVGERPLYGRRSPDRTLNANWFANQQRRESPQRDRSRDNRVQPWSRGPDSRGPWAPDSRPSRDDQFEPRPDFRSNERAGLPNSQPDFGSEGRRNQFTGRMREFPERQGRPNEREGFHGRSDEFSSNNRHRQNEFAGRSTDRHGPNEFAWRSTDLHGPNEFARRSTDRHGPNEFAGRSTDLHGPNEFSRRSKDRQGPNKFTGRPNEFTGRPSEFNNRPNEGQRRPNEHRGRPNDQGRQNEYQGRQNENQGRRNEYQGRQNEYQVRQNEFSERKERPNRPGFSRPNDHQFDRLDERNKINRLNDREILKRFDSKPKPNFLETRKRKFDDTFDGTIERPERVSCPKNIQQQPPGTQNKNIPLQDPNLIMSDGNKTKLSTRMREAGVRKIVMEIVTCLGIRNPNLDMKRMMRKLVLERLQNLLGDRTMVTPLECCKIYRSTYPNIEDTAILDSALAMLAKQRADKGIVPGATAASKPGSANEPINITGSLKQVYKKMKEAKSLLSQGKLPKFPQGDKRKVAQQKREEKTGHIPEVDPLTKAAIEAELDDIAELFTAEFDSATTLKLQRAYSTVNRSELINDIKMNLTEKLSRRISNTGLIIVRIYGHPKLPQRPVLEKVLLRFGVQSLRKSEKAKMYTAAVDTYKNYDKLMAKRTIDVGDGITISFKPFHLAPKERADQKQLKIMRKKMIEDMIDKSDLNLLDKDWPAKAAEIKRREASNERENATLEAEAQQQIASEAQAQQLAVLEAGGKENYSDTKEDVVGVTDENESNKNDTNDYLHEDFHVIDEVHADSDVEFTENIIETVNIDDDEENENFEASNQDKIENNEVNNEDKIENYEVNNEDKIENNEVNNEDKIENNEVNNEDKIENNEVNNEDKIENNEVNNEDKIENNEVNNEDKIENYEVNNDDKIENNEMNNEDKIENNEVNNEDNIENYEMNSSNDDGNDGYFEGNDPDENNDLDDTQEGNADCDIGDLDIDIDHVDDDDLEDY